jgi:peroxiredoxin
MACGWLTAIFTVGAIMIDVAPDIELPDHTGQTWQLGRALGLGSVLVVFYRGDW